MVDDKEKKPEEQPSRKRSFLSRLGSFVKWMVVLGFMGILFVGGALTGYIASIVKDEPVRSRAAIEQAVSENSLTGFAYFADGSAIGQLRTEEDRRIVELEDIPQVVLDAVVSIEDDSFYEHKGVDITGTLRAVKEKVLNEPVQTGGSTLTQQLARRVFLSLDKTEDRKVKEILLSLRLERFLTKDEIITAYLNKVPFGNGSSGYNVYGIKAAAKGIFNVNDLNDLNTAQAAYLAGLPQLPSAYSAFNGKGEFNEDNFNNAVERQQRVLGRMLALGKITQSEYDEAMAFDLKSSLAPRVAKAYNTYPYLMLETERQAAKVLIDVMYPDGEEADKSNSELMEEALQKLRTGGYRVYTTINKNVYKTMRAIAEDDSNFSAYNESKGLEQTAAMMIDHKTGAILGMIEGRDFNTENMNLATQMVRQPGSAMKPIAAYLPALEEGIIQPASILDDSPIILKDGQKGYHIPKNSNGNYKGLVTARYALNQSLNVPALKIFNEKLGLEKAWDFAKTLGITTLTDIDYTNATTGVLGGLTYGVSVEELTNAYGAIANNGVYNDAYMIQKIVDSKGNIVFSHEEAPKEVFSKETAYLMTDMLKTVISDGTGKLVRDNFNKYGDIDIAGKTGTTQNYADVWFQGYTPDVTLGVWVGYNNKETLSTLAEGAERERARRLWAKILNNVIEAEPDLFPTKTFTKPENITTKTVSAYSGKLPTSLTDKFVTDIFNTKYVPTESDDAVAKAKYITYNGVNYIPRDETPSDMLKEQTVVKRERPISELIKQLQEAFKVMAEHESLSYYMPDDADEDMPKQIDPRKDDGANPDAPANVRMSTSNGNAVITFNPSGAKDVVGYRLYRSMNGGTFQNQGKVVLAGNPTTFTSYAGSNVQFYIVAVDVAGRESAPSAIVSGGNQVPVNPPEEETPGDPIEVPGTVVTEDESQNEDDSTDSNASGVPATPSGVSAQVTDQGIVISWTAQEGVTGFNVYYSDTGQEPFQHVGTAGFTSFTYNNAEAKGAFRITAVNEAGESSPSAPVSP
ncbi:transglycosylase domain-containing protein [Neobacillus mesonae]|nr:transglycosylase domain-containing protein [Neobacillus mesonae]